METKQINLSLLPLSYTGNPQTFNVHPFSPEIHDEPGIYLEHQSGCGYSPYALTPIEARTIASALIAAADWADKQTWIKIKE